LGVLLGGEIGPSKTRDVVGQDSQAKQGYICGLRKIWSISLHSGSTFTVVYYAVFNYFVQIL